MPEQHTNQLARREPDALAAPRPDLAEAIQLLNKPETAPAKRQQIADGIRQIADSGRTTIAVAIDALRASKDAKLSLSADIAALRAKLGHAESPLVEQLLIDQIAICHLRMITTEQMFSGMNRESMTMAQGAYWQRKLSSTQARYLRSLETLARVRKLMRPLSIQVNLATQGGQQIIANTM